MSDQELNDLLWRSFYLGTRIGSSAENPDQLDAHVRTLGELARGELTLQKPRSPAGSTTAIEQVLAHIRNGAISADRELARRILAGLELAATVPEAPDNALPLHAEPPPLRIDAGGVVRVGRSRISLDLLVEQYDNGMTPDEMVRAYDTLRPADVYAAIGYYLRHPDEVRAYLERRRVEAEALRGKIEAERPRVTRELLLARRGAPEADHAPAGQ